jgi:hypothetical protein
VNLFYDTDRGDMTKPLRFALEMQKFLLDDPVNGDFKMQVRSSAHCPSRTPYVTPHPPPLISTSPPFSQEFIFPFAASAFWDSPPGGQLKQRNPWPADPSYSAGAFHLKAWKDLCPWGTCAAFQFASFQSEIDVTFDAMNRYMYQVLHCTALHFIQKTALPCMHCTALHCTALHCTALPCPALHCTALHCTALPCPALHALPCPALHCTALPCPALPCTALHCTALHCAALPCPALPCTALPCPALHCTALHCTALHFTALHCTALHCIALAGLTDYYNACLNPTHPPTRHTQTYLPLPLLLSPGPHGSVAQRHLRHSQVRFAAQAHHVREHHVQRRRHGRLHFAGTYCTSDAVLALPCPSPPATMSTHS